jgi:hypothetical protein
MGGIVGRVRSTLNILRGSTTPVKIPHVKMGLHYGQTVQGERFGPAGDDSPPLPEDLHYAGQRNGTGRRVYLGSIDIKNDPEASAGEKRIYARDADAEIKAVIWLKANGDIEIASDGDIIFNQGTDYAVQFTALKTAFDQLLADFNAFVAVYNLHTHASAPVGPVAPPTGTGVTSSADIDPAKVEKVRFP